MLSGPRAGSGARTMRAGRLTMALVAIVALGAASCGGDEAGFEKTPEGFNIEPSAEVGPHAFTPSIANGDTQNAMGLAPAEGESAAAGDGSPCDTDQFVKELQKRPDAYREWARVLGLKQDAVPAYVKGLKSVVLTSDTKVTNHGLKDGRAYPRQSVLVAGTAVLVDATPGGTVASTTSSSAPAATAPGGGVIVTRCKCGNPLLPPGDPKAPDTEPPATEAPGTSTPGTTPGTASPGTSPRSTNSSRPASTATTRSSTTSPSSTASTGSSTTAG